MWNISFILGSRIRWSFINRVIDSLNEIINIENVVLHTPRLTDVNIEKGVLRMGRRFVDLNIIVKELIRGDFLGGILSTMQLIDEGRFIIIDLDIFRKLEWLDSIPLERETVILLKRFGRKGFKLNIALGKDGSIRISPYKSDSRYTFAGVFIYGSRFIEHLKKMLLLYYNPDFLRFENILDSYTYRVGDIYGYIVD